MAEDLQEWAYEMPGFAEAIVQQIEPDLVYLMSSLSDRQVEKMLTTLAERQQDQYLPFAGDFAEHRADRAIVDLIFRERGYFNHTWFL